MHIRSLLLLSLLTVGSQGFANIANQIVSSREPLVIKQNNDVTQLRSYLVQRDQWSCGLRSAFHAIAFERALKNPGNFEEALKRNLQDGALLNELDRRYGNDRGLTNVTITQIAQDYGFGNKIVCLGLNNHNQIGYLGNVSFSYRPGASRDQLVQLQKQAIQHKLQDTIVNLTKIAKRAPQAVYFVAGAEHHWALFAIVNLPGRPAKLYLIDSNNDGGIPTRSGWQRYIALLKQLVQEVNSGKPIAERRPITPAIAAHIAKKAHDKKRNKPTAKHHAKARPQQKQAYKKHKKHAHKKKHHHHKKRAHKRVSLGKINPATARALHLMLKNKHKAQAPSNCPFAYALFKKYGQMCC